LVGACCGLQERVNNVVDELAELKARVSTLTEKHSQDGSTTAAASAAAVSAQLLQQAFINFTRHIYQIEGDARRQQHGKRQIQLLQFPRSKLETSWRGQKSVVSVNCVVSFSKFH